MRLKEYRAKRNFRRTREPAGERSRRSRRQETFFVVQKHAATRLHYDFRLAMGGVLKSWAVPKGFPVARGDRRLAVQVEDHPIDYARFEGTIAAGNYGAGTVMVWDLGSYQVESDDPEEALEQGKLHLILNGKKLKGEWTLVRMRAREHEDKPAWLLFKTGADAKPISRRADDESVLTHRSMERIGADNNAQWASDHVTRRDRTPLPLPESGRRGVGHYARHQSSVADVRATIRNLPSGVAEFVEPMKALLVEALPGGSDWLYEIKFDGVRAIAVLKGKRVELISRNQKSFASKYPDIVEAVKHLQAKEAVLDGEIAALDPEGRSSFQLLQSYQVPGASRPPLFYYVFDLLELDGKDLTGLTLAERKALAEELVADAPEQIRFSAAMAGEPRVVVKEMRARGLEGLIAKRRQSKYEMGRRSGAWVKFKWTQEQEFVIGGYTEPHGSRSHFGAILVGCYDRKKLMFASKVGTGFDQRLLESLFKKFRKLEQEECPFANLPQPGGGRWNGGLTAAEMRRCVWLRPELVCEVRFSEWTRDGHLRQPAFLGLREDKRPEEVEREKAARGGRD